jgi:hypothetical protein
MGSWVLTATATDSFRAWCRGEPWHPPATNSVASSIVNANSLYLAACDDMKTSSMDEGGPRVGLMPG